MRSVATNTTKRQHTASTSRRFIITLQHSATRPYDAVKVRDEVESLAVFSGNGELDHAREGASGGGAEQEDMGDVSLAKVDVDVFGVLRLRDAS